MVRKWGDVCPHETLIAHIRRLLDQEFVSSRLSETPAQFKQRLQRVEDHLNSAALRLRPARASWAWPRS